jgi:GNAT superfamily N-acetyltransferase
VTGFQIRTLAAGEGEAARTLMREYLAELGLSFDPARLDADLVDPAAYYAPPQAAFFLAVTQDGEPVGTAAVRPLTADTCELKRMFVRGAYRGRGLGRLLVDAALEFARRAGYRRMKLDSRPDLTAALALYRRSGFRPCADYNGNERAGVFLEKEL